MKNSYQYKWRFWKESALALNYFKHQLFTEKANKVLSRLDERFKSQLNANLESDSYIIEIQSTEQFLQKVEALLIEFQFNGLVKRSATLAEGPAKIISTKDSFGRHIKVGEIINNRFISIPRFELFKYLLELEEGALPFTISPLQCVIVSNCARTKVHENFENRLKKHAIFYDTLSKEADLRQLIKSAAKLKAPFIAIISHREVETQTIALRKRKIGDIGQFKVNQYPEIFYNCG